MKKKSKETIGLIFAISLYIIFFILITVFYLWVKADSNNVKTAKLSDATVNGAVYTLPDFEITLGPRG